jgi:hypothetical protein
MGSEMEIPLEILTVLTESAEPPHLWTSEKP